jgi:hypothetical protein
MKLVYSGSAGRINKNRYEYFITIWFVYERQYAAVRAVFSG